jgi:hypothetical protein
LNKVKPSPPLISDQDVREHLKRALLRFAANVQPAFCIDQETKFLSYRSDFPGFLGSGKKGGDHRTLKLCAAEPPIEGELTHVHAGKTAVLQSDSHQRTVTQFQMLLLA